MMKTKKITAETTDKSMRIVAIGASSGGLEAGLELFKYLPADTGMAFIFIQHLSPSYKSILTSLLAKATKMKVQEIEDMEHMKPDNVYVIPNDKGIKVTDGHIQLIPRSKSVTAVSIDVLFASLAETHKEDAIGIVLSGSASDGTVGLRAIKQEGGITFAQDNSAKYDSMPESAINEGVADFILSPKEIARELSRISKHVFKNGLIAVANEGGIEDDNPDLKTIIRVLHKETGIDFSHYKMGTIKRRILRRMFLYRLKSLSQYVQLLQTRANETTVLYNDMLINVTDFFRDEEAFQHLKNTVLPKLLKSKTHDQPLRIWVAACSTGQEAYSIAILLAEILGGKLPMKKIQIFATDLSLQAIKKARKGEYSKYEISAVSPQRLAKFFEHSDGVYKVVKEIRDVCSFAPPQYFKRPAIFPHRFYKLLQCAYILRFCFAYQSV
jgi:two-component system CheB/CheR fusion protein